MRIVTELDADNGALLARNRFNADFSTAVAFVDVNARPRIWTCDRTEFLGRNGSLAAPAALELAVWSGSAGAARPCAALQISSTFNPARRRRSFFCSAKPRTLRIAASGGSVPQAGTGAGPPLRIYKIAGTEYLAQCKCERRIRLWICC